MSLRRVLQASAFSLFAFASLAPRTAHARANEDEDDGAASDVTVENAETETPKLRQAPLAWPGSQRTDPRFLAQQVATLHKAAVTLRRSREAILLHKAAALRPQVVTHLLRSKVVTLLKGATLHKAAVIRKGVTLHKAVAIRSSRRG